ncbi:carboxypeptidase-like regulatory domain-containing protein [Lacinutrix sp.]|uniref:carboxypeptidase-like regulatory domain-containing protein n=1 Tax=Lacinutrix sp. TaxID=1937692 RepID=UPI0030EEBE41
MATLKIILFSLIFISFQNTAITQNTNEFKGKVIDDDTKKALPLADLLIMRTNISTITNSEGEFLLKVPNEFMDKPVLISYLGYKKQQIPLSQFKSKNTKIALTIAATVLAQVDVNAPKDAKNPSSKSTKFKR